MGIRHMTYLDIPEEKRREAAANSRNKIREHMSSPFITKTQHDKLVGQLGAVDKWMEGTLHFEQVAPAESPSVEELTPAPDVIALGPGPELPLLEAHPMDTEPPPAQRVPVHHGIEVVDGVDVHET